MVVIVRSVVNFFVLKTYEPLLTARFVCILCLGLSHILCASSLVQRPNMMAFRVGGALESVQEQYYLLNVCFSMVTFDLQAQLCLCILILKWNEPVYHNIILAVGLVWACITAAIGATAVLKEVKPLVWTFLLLNLPELAYFVFLLYTIILQWGQDGSYTLEAAAVTGCTISVVIKGILLWGLSRLYRTFGQGLRERMFAPDRQ
ncbi:uncharacterized protein LOC115821210 [Chanos chanos]|uniref:Uncharacterized protein LOC115821210 n=1 Tax=Chanos chanos TaxID=29144 RepID=A0A6J2WBY3_CHACN|nr:uncharacterized protein LOC115821210 [Chanos chanos]